MTTDKATNDTGPQTEDLSAFVECGVCGAPLDPESEGIDVCETCWRKAHRG